MSARQIALRSIVLNHVRPSEGPVSGVVLYAEGIDSQLALATASVTRLRAIVSSVLTMASIDAVDVSSCKCIGVEQRHRITSYTFIVERRIGGRYLNVEATLK